MEMKTLDNKTLREHYFNKYGKPTSSEEEISFLNIVYGKLVGAVTADIREGISEYHEILTDRKLPALSWLFESFAEVNRKHMDKRNFGYIVGILRSWMKNGFKMQPNDEEEEIFDYFAQVTGVAINFESKELIRQLIGTYGAVRVTRIIGGLGKDADLSLQFAKVLREKIEQRFNE